MLYRTRPLLLMSGRNDRSRAGVPGLSSTAEGGRSSNCAPLLQARCLIKDHPGCCSEGNAMQTCLCEIYGGGGWGSPGHGSLETMKGRPDTYLLTNNKEAQHGFPIRALHYLQNHWKYCICIYNSNGVLLSSSQPYDCQPYGIERNDPCYHQGRLTVALRRPA